ncbi:MAG: MBL fold metallo-hydrolase [Myxococcales bacterium]|nr:MBL fold metallo-hydrolase [Myxococcales bacterium]
MTKPSELALRYLSGAQSPTELPPFAGVLGLEEIEPGLAFVSSFGNVTALDTAEGLVLLDTGSFFLAQANHLQIRAWSRAPLRLAVYTHGHVDHACGLAPFEAEARSAGAALPEVVAHEAVARRFERYQLTRGYNTVINQRQFQATNVPWPESYRYPDRSYARDLALEVGGEKLELHHALGETDDHTWIWLPGRATLVTGDLFIWASPNCGNPQKAQRYPREWAAALRTMAALAPERLFPGHGPPVLGAAAVALALSETAELLELLVAQTLAAMNAGASLDETVARVKAPERLLARPYLAPLYDEPEFVVRNLWRLYGGWWDGNPAHLKPAREAELGAELAALAGGADRLVTRALALAAEGRFALGCELVEHAYRAAPDDAAVRSARTDLYTRRAAREASLMARGVYTAAATETRAKS